MAPHKLKKSPHQDILQDRKNMPIEMVSTQVSEVSFVITHNTAGDSDSISIQEFECNFLFLIATNYFFENSSSCSHE